MNRREAATLIGELKGAAASITLALTILNQPLTLPELGIITRYTPPTLRAAVHRLALLGFLQEEQRLGQYILTTQARQFILGEVGLVIEETDREAFPIEKNFFPAHERNVNLPQPAVEETSLSNVDAEKIPWDEDAEDAVKLLMETGRWERTKNGKGARDAVEAALAAGWNGAHCYNHILDCLDYSRTEAAKGIKDVGGWIAYTLREQIPAPKPKEPPGTRRPEDYISGEFAHLIKH